MITKEKNLTKIICAVVTAISAIVASGSAFQLHNVQNISQTVNGNVLQILGETGSYVSAGTDLTDSTDELISAYRKVLDEILMRIISIRQINQRCRDKSKAYKTKMMT